MSSSIALFRRLALSLPNAIEGAHMGHPDFRILMPDGKTRIFATLSAQDKGYGMVRLTPEQQNDFQSELPDVFEPVPGGWGRLGSTWVHLDDVDQGVLLGALSTAHRNMLTKRDPSKPESRSSARLKTVAKSPTASRAAKPKMEK
jgi:hypothetical protein